MQSTADLNVNSLGKTSTDFYTMMQRNTSCADISATVIFGLETVGIAVVAILAQILNFLCLLVVTKSGGSLPSSVKFMVINCNLAFFIRSTFFVLLSTYHILLWFLDFERVAVSKIFCAIFEYFYFTPIMAGYLSLFFISLERLWATYANKNKIGEAEAPRQLIFAACGSTWIFSSFIYSALVATGIHKTPEEFVCYCYVTAIFHSKGVKACSSTMIGLQVLTCCVYYVVNRLNRSYLCEFTLNTARHSLTERFVMWSNVSASRWLMPISVFHAAVTVSLMFTVNVGLTGFSGRFDSGYVNFIAGYLCVFCLECLVHPYLCIKLNRSLRSVIAANFPKWAGLFGPWRRLVDKGVFAQPEVLAENKLKKQSEIVDLKVKGDDCCEISEKIVQPGTRHVNKMTGKKTIIDYRVPPGKNQDILDDLWNSACK